MVAIGSNQGRKARCTCDVRAEQKLSEMHRAAVCSAVSSCVWRNFTSEAVRELSNMLDIFCLARQILYRLRQL